MMVEVIPLCSTAAGGLGELRMSAVPPEMKRVPLNIVKLKSLEERERWCAHKGDGWLV